MTYHFGLGNQAIVPLTFGYWKVSDPEIVKQLTAAGVSTSDLPVPLGVGLPSRPWFGAFIDMRDYGTEIVVVTVEGTTKTRVSGDRSARLQQVIRSIPDTIPKFTLQQVNAEIQGSRSTPVVTPGQSQPATTPPVIQGDYVRRDNSKTGLYIGVGVAAVLLLVGLGAFRKGS